MLHLLEYKKDLSIKVENGTADFIKGNFYCYNEYDGCVNVCCGLFVLPLDEEMLKQVMQYFEIRS